VIHNTATHEVKVYINDKLKLSTQDRGLPAEGFWYFKTGVYMQDGGSSTMQLKVRDLSIWKK
jgi:hypothetical protein